MSTQYDTHRSVAGVVLIACMLVRFSASTACAQQLSREVRSAWRKAGAEVKNGNDRVPAYIAFRNRPSVGFDNLPAPNVPFTLELNATDLKGDDFKRLAGMKALKSLALNGGLTTPPGNHNLEGLGVLAELPDLRVLKLETLNPTKTAYAEVGKLKQLREIHIFRARLDDDAMTQLGKLPELQVFHSSHSYGKGCEARDVTAAGLKGLAAATRLREVDVTWLPLDDEGFKHLAGLKDLQTLRVSGPHTSDITVSDEGFKHLAGAAKLSHLGFVVIRSRVTDEGIKPLAGLKELKTLRLRYSEVTDEGLKHLSGLNKLETLDLSATAISTAGLDHLRGLANLTYLDLQGNGSLTAAGLKPLQELKRLETLELFGTKMYGTPARDKLLAEFCKAVPKCKITTANSYGAP